MPFFGSCAIPVQWLTQARCSSRSFSPRPHEHSCSRNTRRGKITRSRSGKAFAVIVGIPGSFRLARSTVLDSSAIVRWIGSSISRHMSFKNGLESQTGQERQGVSFECRGLPSCFGCARTFEIVIENRKRARWRTERPRRAVLISYRRLWWGMDGAYPSHQLSR